MKGGRISKVTPGGAVSTVVSALPSSQTSAALGNLVSGVSSVAFIGNQLYALLAGASHCVPTVPNGVINVNADGTWSMIANLSAFQAEHSRGESGSGRLRAGRDVVQHDRVQGRALSDELESRRARSGHARGAIAA